MLALVAIFLVTIIVSALAVWIHRKLAGRHGFAKKLVGRPKSRKRMRVGTQHGFISLVSKREKKSKTVTLRSANKNIETPWGW